MTKITKIDKWNIFFSIIFIILAVLVARSIPSYQVINIEWFEFLLLALATFRLIRLFVYDKIMHWFKQSFECDDNSCKMTVYSLLDCPWCFGVWATLIVTAIYFLIPFGDFFILLLAISGLATIIQIYINGVGWTAEERKIEVKDLQKKK